MEPRLVRTAGRPRAGSHIGPFRLDRFLGGGADTEVWRADGDGILVALKLLRNPTDLIAAARLAHEALALDLVRHPNVIHRFDADDRDGVAWLATALVDAGTLAARLDEGLLTVGEAAAALAPIAEALAAAHALGVVHRDVNPANILLALDGPQLIDFGHAAIGGRTWDGWTSTGAAAVARTEGYAAPESMISPALDAFGVGVTLLEAVTGRRSLDALTTRREREAAVPIADLVARCCDRDPNRRPAMSTIRARLRDLAGATRPPMQAPPVVVDLVRAEQVDTSRSTGRDAEFDRLARSVRAACSARELGAVLIVAPAGAGKSWLLDHALDSLATEIGAVARRTRCTETTGDLRVLRALVEQDLGDPRIGAATAALLRSAVGIGGGATDATTRDLTEAILTVFRLRPTILVVDDLHWAEPDLLEILSSLAFRTGVSGAMLFGTRPGYLDPDDLDVETIALGPLDDATLRAAVLDVAEPAFVDAAIAIAAGNPLHAREAARALNSGIDLSDATDLHAVVAARLGAADAHLAPAIAIAAATGDGFWPEVIGDELLDQIPRLVRSGYARPRLRSSLRDAVEFEWAHPLLREVAYERLTALDRRVLHGRLARRFDERDDIDAESIARHAGLAFRGGDSSIAPLAARRAAESVREALDHYAVNRAEEWAELLRETEREPALADLLAAEVKNRQGDFTAALHLLLPHVDRDDGIGTRALAVGTESLVGTGDHERAVDWGRAASNRTQDALSRVRGARALATALRETARLAEALDVLDEATAIARELNERVLALRLAADATTAAQAINQDTPGSLDSIRRARAVLAEIIEIRDDSALLELAESWVTDAIAIEDPQLAADIQERSLELAEARGDRALAARAARRVIEVGWDAERLSAIRTAMPYLRDPPVTASERIMMAVLVDVSSTIEVHTDPQLGDRLTALVGELDHVAEAGGPDQHLALCAFAYVGRAQALADALTRFEARRNLPRLFAIMSRLNLAILRCEPLESIRDDVPSGTTAFHNELAALAYLHDDAATGDHLLRERHAFLVSTGNTHQGYAPTFSGALFSALGPPDCEPNVEWLVRQIMQPAFPGLWTFQRAITAMLLAQRSGPKARELLDAARRLRSQTTPDETVAAWFDPRLDRLGPSARAESGL